MGRVSISTGLFPKKSTFRQRCRRRCTHIDVAGAPQVVHLPDPDNFDSTGLSELSQGHRNGGVGILGKIHPGDSASKQLLFQLLHSDDFSMVPKLGELVVTRGTPYIHGIHTNQYYTCFFEKVNVFLLKNPLFLAPRNGCRMCTMSTRRRQSMHTSPEDYSESQIAVCSPGFIYNLQHVICNLHGLASVLQSKEKTEVLP